MAIFGIDDPLSVGRFEKRTVMEDGGREGYIEVNVRAANKMALLHDALKNSGYEGHDLEVYLVRLL
ncbi:MAG: hypothetical protein LBB40_04630, partial [Holophagales bacterium]|nr:hypothetical protein [Holophagales bacterium]